MRKFLFTLLLLMIVSPFATYANGDEFYFGFEANLDGFVNIDADGDGSVWYQNIQTDLVGPNAIGHNGSSGYAYSESFNQYGIPLTPDNYMATADKFTIGSSSLLRFWASAQDVNYAGEHFGVAVSTAGNTSASDFTTIAEWTMTAKGEQGKGQRGSKEQGTWYLYEVDLSSYAGQELYIAIRHFNSTDLFYICVDDLELVNYEFPCDAPKNVYVEATYNEDGTFGATLKMSYDPNASDWLYYDDGINIDALGGETLSTMYWGVMFPDYMISEYEGLVLTKVSMYVYAYTSGDINIYHGGNNAPGELIHSQPYSTSTVGEYEEFELTTALPIDPSMNLWVTFSSNQGENYPAATAADCGNPNARWISVDGEQWFDFYIVTGGYLATWMVRAFVESARGEVAELSPITDYEYTASTGDVVRAGAPKNNYFDHYNIYRSTTNDNYELVGESTSRTYFDELTELGTYYYKVTSFYSSDEEECESEPAPAYGDDTQDYVVVEVVSIEENGVKGMMIYPNPTQGNLTINAEAMNRITITNALGQVIYDQKVATDNKVINMSQYEAGIYMVRIETTTGIAVERVTVVK